MNIGELKELIKDIPNDVNIFIEDMENFSTQDFEVSTYYEGDTWVDLIMPVYIKDYIADDEEETEPITEEEMNEHLKEMFRQEELNERGVE